MADRKFDTFALPAGQIPGAATDSRATSIGLTAPVLILPGLGNSGPEHWQSRWEALHPEFQRVEQQDWATPVYADWRDALEAAVAAAPQPPILVAHSLACLLVARWVQESDLPVQAALLVAPPDLENPQCPVGPQGFGPLPSQPLPFSSILVASRDDPYGDIIFAASCAALWGSRFVDAGYRGHINGDSNLGDWPWGQELLQQLDT